ncbi:MAG: DUF2782 domain-containing protein [Pseudomonadales bacterium]|nr:DUF2782 domain-containing protein [Pseudomonadales bacterium]NIX08713.1 DUF2782 domain-containing protein [Pseudomonadales bacterium]
MQRSPRTLSQTRRKGAAALTIAAAALIPAAALGSEAEDGLRGPDITIIAQEDKTILEFRQAGQLRMVKVVPRLGKPYYLVPRDSTTGFGDLQRADMLLPSWVIVEF